jgi:hypothetical protein
MVEPGFALLTDNDAREEDGAENCYGFVGNSPLNDVDDLGLVDVKFEVTQSSFWSGSWGGLAWGWGQPYWAAEGSYSIGATSANSYVKVFSGLHGHTCNTLDQGNAGTITLFLRENNCPGKYHVTIQANVILAGYGSAGNAAGSIFSGSDNKELWNGHATKNAPINLSQTFSFDTYIGPSWTVASYYVPTISFVLTTAKYKPESSGLANGTIIFVSATTPWK